MTPRKKLPAYGKALREQRMAGNHPLTVHVVIGDRWRDAVAPKLCVSPAEYGLGVYDWSVLAGVRALVVDQSTYGACVSDGALNLAGELADHAAVVEFWLDGGPVPASVVAWGARGWSADKQQIIWPRWWNDAREARQSRSVPLWYADAAREASAGAVSG